MTELLKNERVEFRLKSRNDFFISISFKVFSFLRIDLGEVELESGQDKSDEV